MQLLFFVLPTAPELSLFISIANSTREREIGVPRTSLDWRIFRCPRLRKA